jgi:dipeptidyl-peptidase-3
MIDKKINYPIMNLDFIESFEQLTHDEKLYCYHFQKACWQGAPIVLFQISYESPALFIVFQTFFSSFQPFEELKKAIFLKTG